MNRKQLALLLFLVVVVGIAGLVVYHKQNDVSKEGDPAIGKKLLGDFPFNDVAHIVLKQGTNEVNLVKKDNLWRVREREDYPANYSSISGFLIKAKDLKIIQSEQVGPSQLARFELVPGQGTNAALVVDFKDQADKPIKSLLLGKKHMHKPNGPSPYGGGAMNDPGWPDGRYVKADANSHTVALISEAFENIEPKADQWLNKDFFKVEKVRSVAVAFPEATNSWKLTRDSETAEWKLAEAKPGEQLDSSKISALSNPLSSPTFTDVDTVSKPAQLGLDKPTVITLDTFDHFTYSVKIGHKTNDNYPMTVAVAAQLPKERTPGKDEKPADKAKLDKEFKDGQKKLADKLAQEQAYGKWTYLVSTWTLDPLLKHRSELLQEKKVEAKKDAKSATSSSGTATPATPAAKPAALAP